MSDLLKPEGKLHPILERTKKDQTLMLAIRDGYFNIYYRGGNILRVTEKTDFYETFFDVQFAKFGQEVTCSEKSIRNQIDSQKLVTFLSDRKLIMDEYFSVYGKAEREFQQLVARENNNSSISNQTEYFITDIEFAAPFGRFDMLAIRWPASKRKGGKNCRVAVIEVKYGDGALGGDAGILKHLEDMENLIADKAQRYPSLLKTIQSQFNQLYDLGLIKFHKGKNNAKIELNASDVPEVIFIIANHNPRSTKLKKILDLAEIQKFQNSELFDLKFFVASFAGYGLHTDCMHTLAEFKKFL